MNTCYKIGQSSVDIGDMAYTVRHDKNGNTIYHFRGMPCSGNPAAIYRRAHFDLVEQPDGLIFVKHGKLSPLVMDVKEAVRRLGWKTGMIGGYQQHEVSSAGKSHCRKQYLGENQFSLLGLVDQNGYPKEVFVALLNALPGKVPAFREPW